MQNMPIAQYSLEKSRSFASGYMQDLSLANDRL